MITNCTYMFRNECDTMNVPQRWGRFKRLRMQCRAAWEIAIIRMPDWQRVKYHAIIHAASTGCAVVGVGPTDRCKGTVSDRKFHRSRSARSDSIKRKILTKNFENPENTTMDSDKECEQANRTNWDRRKNISKKGDSWKTLLSPKLEIAKNLLMKKELKGIKHKNTRDHK